MVLRLGDAHVIWHEINYETEVAAVQFGDDRVEFLARADLRVERIVVANVGIAVRAAGHRAKDRRGVVCGWIPSASRYGTSARASRKVKPLWNWNR